MVEPQIPQEAKKRPPKRLDRLERELKRIEADLRHVATAQHRTNDRFSEFGVVVQELTRQLVHHRANVERLETRAGDALTKAQQTLNVVAEHVDWEQQQERKRTKEWAILLRNIILLSAMIGILAVVLDAIHTISTGKSVLIPLFPFLVP